jgi:hypothetical protein
MALPSYYTPAKPYTPPAYAGQQEQNQLYRALSSAGASMPDGSAAPPNPPAPGGAHVQTRIPYDEYGTNSSAPKYVGQVPAGYQPPAAAAPAAGAGGGGGGGSGGYSFEGDPILARTRAYTQMLVSQAEASALAQRKQQEIGYGYDPALKYEDPATQEAARQNPFSVIAQLLFGHTERGRGLTEALNKSNLFYSGENLRQTGLEGRQYTLEQTNAQGQHQNVMNQIARALMDTQLQAQQQNIQAEENAYNRAIQLGLGPGGYGGGDGGGGGGGAQSSWGGYGLAPGANSFAGAGQQEAPNAVQFNGQGNPQPSWGGWGSQGPGLYVAQKFPPTVPGGGSDTRWVKVG